MNDLKNWTEVTRGIYRYVFGIKACYEIHVYYHKHGTDILDARATLYLVGEWRSPKGTNYFSRETIVSQTTVRECIEKAVKDDEQNNNH